MSYAVELALEAQEELRRLSVEVAEIVLDRIDSLATNPTQLSQKDPDAKSRLQIYRSTWRGLEGRYVIKISFQYSQDEQTLCISLIEVRVT